MKPGVFELMLLHSKWIGEEEEDEERGKILGGLICFRGFGFRLELERANA